LDEWADHDLVVAAHLAHVQYDIESNRTALRLEGDIVEGRLGPMVNPRMNLVQTLLKTEMALLRTLRLAGAAVGDVRDSKARIKAQRDAERAAEQVEADEDSLLAGR